METGHKDHIYIRLKELSKTQATSLKDLVNLCKDVETKYQSCIKETVQVEESLELSAHLAYSTLDKIKNDYTTHLDFILTGYRQRLRRQETSRSVVIGQAREDLQMSLTELQSACQLASEVVEAGTELQVVSVYASLSATLQKLALQHPYSIDPILGVIQLQGAKEKVDIAMAMVAIDNRSSVGDISAEQITIRSSSQKTKLKLIKVYQTKMGLNYVLVALFAILIYRVITGIL